MSARYWPTRMCRRLLATRDPVVVALADDVEVEAARRRGEPDVLADIDRVEAALIAAGRADVPPPDSERRAIKRVTGGRKCF